jgi:hypothetical protein
VYMDNFFNSGPLAVPPLLPAYNKFMGAVDTLSQVR